MAVSQKMLEGYAALRLRLDDEDDSLEHALGPNDVEFVVELAEELLDLRILFNQLAGRKWPGPEQAD